MRARALAWVSLPPLPPLDSIQQIRQPRSRLPSPPKSQGVVSRGELPSRAPEGAGGSELANSAGVNQAGF